ALFLTIGPPTAMPGSSRFQLSCGYVTYSALLASVRFSRSVGTPVPDVMTVVNPLGAGACPFDSLSPCQLTNPYPCQLLVPLFVTALITPPIAPPYSAV